MTKQIALITGTSTGLGLALSEQLARSGWRVYATMRNVEKGASITALQQQGLDIELLPLDVQSQQSIDDAIETIITKDRHIDLLINNAGIGFIKNTEQATEEEYKQVFDINTFGQIRCTKAVLPYMRQNKQGKIISISSVGGLVGQPMNEIYCASKFALEGFYESLATYVTPYFGISFMIVEPGGISSEFANSVLSKIQNEGGLPQDEYGEVLQDYMGTRDTRSEGVFQTAEEVAKVVLSKLNVDPLPLRVRTSPWAEEFCRYKTEADPDGLLQTKAVTSVMLGNNYMKRE